MPHSQVRRGSWTALGVAWPLTPVTQKDVAVWPCSVNILLEIPSFLATLHWPRGAADLGKFGNYFLELLIMFEQLDTGLFAKKLVINSIMVFSGTLKEVQLSFGTLQLRYSSAPFSKRFPTCLVAFHPVWFPEVVASSRIHFPCRDTEG